MYKYKSIYNVHNLNIKNILKKSAHPIIYNKSKLINIYMLLDILKIHNGKFFFKKHVSVWSFGYSFGQLVWTKKRAKYKSKLKLKVKIKMLAQKKQKQKQKTIVSNQKKLYNRFKKVIIPKLYLNKIKHNIKLR